MNKKFRNEKKNYPDFISPDLAHIVLNYNESIEIELNETGMNETEMNEIELKETELKRIGKKSTVIHMYNRWVDKHKKNI